MRSKPKRRGDIIAKFSPLYMAIMFGIFLAYTSIITAWTPNYNEPDIILTAFVAFAIMVVSATAVTSQIMTKRDPDQEVAASLNAELVGIEKSLHHNNNCKYNNTLPLRHKFFDSMIVSGMISHVNPDYLYDLEDVYCMIKDYKKYVKKCQSKHSKSESQKSSECPEDSSEQECQTKQCNAHSQKNYEEYLKCRIKEIRTKLEKDAKDSIRLSRSSR